MASAACDGAGLLGAFRAAVASLEASVDEINALNVFPVPDGDTGSNMVATVRSALAEAEALGPAATPERVAAAAAFGALMGARGNSGVITSQILRGLAEGLAGKAHFNALDLANALDLGSRAAYGAVARPVEGTILTVIREAAAGAVAAAERERDLRLVLAATVDAAADAVARTAALLPILREAGVVDSGGQGLYRLFEGALAFAQEQAPAARRRAAAPRAVPPAVGRVATATPASVPTPALGHPIDDGFGYETMFLARPEPGRQLDIRAIRTFMESVGQSVLIAGDGSAVKVHVHNERPDLVLGYALQLGPLSMISVENLDQQASDVHAARAAAFTVSGVGAHEAVETARDARNGDRADAVAYEAPGLAVVAVAAGDGLAAIFSDFGVGRVVAGGQSSNPSTGELLEAVRSVDAREVLLLPNNPNVILAARQVAAMARRPVAVVATRNAAEGFAALLALDPSKGAAENAERMTAAGRAIQTLAVTEAVRDATLGGRAVKRGQTIALDPDDGLVAVDTDPDAAVLAAIGCLEPGFELITIYYGGDADLADTEALARRVQNLGTGAEVEVVRGGQPHYRYLISAE